MTLKQTAFITTEQACGMVPKDTTVRSDFKIIY